MTVASSFDTLDEAEEDELYAALDAELEESTGSESTETKRNARGIPICWRASSGSSSRQLWLKWAGSCSSTWVAVRGGARSKRAWSCEWHAKRRSASEV